MFRPLVHNLDLNMIIDETNDKPIELNDAADAPDAPPPYQVAEIIQDTVVRGEL